MTEITFKGGPIHLKGQQINEGDFAPDFTVLDNDLNQVTLADYAGKKKLISVVPSIDTGVCDQQTRKFNSDASKEEGLCLQFQQTYHLHKRWCASAGLDNVITLSDHRDLSFGENYGVVMEELRLLARAVFVLDADNKVVYKEIVSEGTDFPDFDAALAAYKNI
ncbi:thiol peroxidase [Staphylococcus aureus]|nr:thiol peroxidase [Staphylococcus aureus]